MSKLYQRVNERIWLSGCLVLSAILQLSFISRSSIWHDEAYSLLLAPQNITDIFTRTIRDVHPPLYYLCLHFWVGLFGTSELAARSLSTLFVLLTIIVSFALMKRLFGNGAARTTALFMATAPFLIRYGQEVRMYAMVAFLVTLATYLLVSALDLQNKKRLYLYAVVMALALYTHYYAVFIIPVHWLYVLSRTNWQKDRPKKSFDLKSWHWWGANIVTAALFIPWVPFAYTQFSRVQTAFWIPSVNGYTLPDSLAQFLQFNHWSWPAWLKLVAAGLVITLSGLALIYNRFNRKSLGLLLIWMSLPPVIVFMLSVAARPIYVDRYFVFVAVAFYAWLSAVLYLKPLSQLARLRPLIIICILVVLGFGVTNVYKQSTHQMRQLAQAVELQFNAGDGLLVGEIYSYLDFSYYNQTGTEAVLYTPNGISTYGESSLIYDKTDQLTLRSYNQVKPATGYVWVIGKAGVKPYFDEIPTSWTLVDHLRAGNEVANRYRLPGSLEAAAANAEPNTELCAQVITRARNSAGGELRDFPSSCLPAGWEPVR